MKTDDTSTLLIAAKLGQNIPQRTIGFFVALTNKKMKENTQTVICKTQKYKTIF